MIDAVAGAGSTLAHDVVNFLIRESAFSLVVAAAVWAILRCWRRAPARMRLALWSLVLLRLVLPPAWGHPLSLRSALDRLAVAVGAGGGTGAEADRIGVPSATEPGGAPGEGHRQAAAAGWSLAGAAWLAGALGVGLVSLRRRAAWRRAAAAGRPVRDERALALLRDWERRLGVGRDVRLVALAGSPPPFTIGTLRPVIAVPAGVLAEESAGVLELVIAHEMAHIRRFDDLQLSAQRVLQALYFFNPAVWLAAGRLHLARECVCDGLVLAERTMTPAAYGRGLFAVLDRWMGPAGAAAPALGDPSRLWRERVEHLRVAARASRRQGLASAAAGVALAFVLLPMSPAPAAATAPKAVPPPAPAQSRPAAPDVALVAPVTGARVSSAFGPRRNPVTGEEEVHNGVDLAARPGTPVVAAADGVVASVTPREGTRDGAAVVIEHSGGLTTVYAYVEAVSVASGARVTAGEGIGKVGTAPGSTGPHLHFEVRSAGTPVNPARYVR